MAVALKGSANAAAATTVTIPSHAAGDLILLWAYRDGNATPPTIPAFSGTVPYWQTPPGLSGGGNANGSVLCWAVATADNHTSGTWTNATGLVAAVFTGHRKYIPFGSVALAGGLQTNQVVSGAITPQNTSGSSLIANFFGHRNVTAWGAAPSGYTQQVKVDTEVCFDTKDSSTSDGAVTQTCTAGNAGTQAVQVEIIAAESDLPSGPAEMVVATGYNVLAASQTPSVTFAGYTPVENDVVVLFPSSTVTAVTVQDVSGWVNPLGSGVDVESDAHEISALYHVVTATDVTNGTITYSATNWFSAAQTGNVAGVILRGLNTAALVDSSNTWNITSNSTSHSIAGLTGANLSTGSIVVAGVAKDTVGFYATPSGWTMLVGGQTDNQAKALCVRDTLTTAGSDIGATTITSSATDEGASIVLAFTAASLPPVDKTDPIGVTDSATRVADAARSATDPVGLTDTATKTAGRTITDTVGVADSVTVTAGRTASDAVGVIDSSVAAQGWARTATDPVDVTDTATKIAGRTASDPVGVTDDATTDLVAAQEFDRTYTDAVGVTDSATAGQVFAETATDPIGITDAAAIVADAVRPATDPVDVIDAADTVSDSIRSLTDPVVAVDAATVTQDWARTATDPAGVTDTALVGQGRAAADPVGLTDTVAVGQDRTTADGIDLADTIASGAGRSPADTAALTDTVTVSQDWARTQTDLIGITDSVTAVLQAAGEANAIDNIGIADSASTQADYIRSATDTIGLSDASTADLGLTASAADPVGVTDAAAITTGRTPDNPVGITDDTALAAARVTTDPVGITDTATADLSLTTAASDPVGLDDTTGFIAEYVRAFTDPLGVADSAEFQLTVPGEFERTFTDAVTVADSASTDADYVRSVVDTLTATDDIQADTGRAVSDPVALGDEVTFLFELRRAFTDPIGITEAAEFSLGMLDITDPIALADLVVIDMWGPADPDRTHPVRAESRTHPVRAESRIHPVRAESHTVGP